MSQSRHHKSNKLCLGYYPIRGKCQISRLLCEYLQIPYCNLFFTPHLWQQFQKTEAKNWDFANLPFLKDNDFIVTQPYAMAMYLIKKANRPELLGKTLTDRLKIENFIWQNDIIGMLLGRIIQLKDLDKQKIHEKLGQFYKTTIHSKIRSIQQNCCEQYYLGYLSIIDFYIYEIKYLFESCSCSQFRQLQKINTICSNIGAIQSIKDYQKSNRAVKQTCPLEFCQRWKSKCSSKNKSECCE